MTPPLIRRAGLIAHNKLCARPSTKTKICALAFNFLDKPVDFGKKFWGWPILGKNKSWRGIVFGIIVGILAALAQRCLYQFSSVQKISLLDYSEINIFLFGFLISSGAVFGDLLFAFIKRRLRMEPGARFLPWDQINYVIGTALFLTPFFKFLKIDILTCPPSLCYWWGVWVTLFVLTFFLHIVFNRLGYCLKLHRAKW